jgi:diacylglycerol kinase family enzyme
MEVSVTARTDVTEKSPPQTDRLLGRRPASVFLVLNPSARSFAGQRQWPALFARLDAAGVPWEFGMTERAGDGRRLAAEAARQGFDLIVAVGGDGTINEVVTGVVLGEDRGALTPHIMGEAGCNCPDGAVAATPPPPPGSSPCPRLPFEETLPLTTRSSTGAPTRGSAPPRVGVVYTGTSPDFCTFHGLSLDPETAVRVMLAGNTRLVDVCAITHRQVAGPDTVSRVFSCSANFGLGAAIARGANTGLRRRWGDFFGTFLSLLGAVGSYRPPTFTVRIDGQEERLPKVFNLFVGKNPYIASGIRLDLNMGPDDGRMFFLPLHGLSRFRLLGLLPRVYTGSLIREFPPRFCRTVEILDGGLADEVEYDGDPQGRLPACIDLLPRALALVR